MSACAVAWTCKGQLLRCAYALTESGAKRAYRDKFGHDASYVRDDGVCAVFDPEIGEVRISYTISPTYPNLGVWATECRSTLIDNAYAAHAAYMRVARPCTNAASYNSSPVDEWGNLISSDDD